MKTFKAIAAMAENRVIGNQGDIPWHLPEDFKWFKQTTMGQILVMGRKTYESIGRPLPGRETFVLSRTPREIEGVHSFTNLEMLDHFETDKTIWIAGGGEIYKQMLPHCSELYLTRVHRTVEGDAHFPEFENKFELAETILKNDDFTVERWVSQSS
ncbi:MAG: dihydrofolate reductase [Opitutae bacterium]|jgi:dihydrofolate reductase|nr:dihydrofolate reductase [Opitutales bacterium]MDG1668469.1 dihydrofolate reductase [Opitutae bacterium]MDB2311025.1 dihydrofolate reductase [Opitutales bacterium]MDB2357870.1 dihydrofolate reductase [Opitutales bacterium]MDB2506267.1 dihydrofolate reductase [Opitutales bacterium]